MSPHIHMRGHPLQTTALVNEAYARLVDLRQVRRRSRAHFFGVAAQLMRHILVDFARARRRVERGGYKQQVSEARTNFFQACQFLTAIYALANRRAE